MALARVVVAACVAACVFGAACARGGKTPEEAYRRLADAVAARDAARLFDALDLQTRWSWMTVQRAQREAYDVVLSTHPEGPDRARLLERLEAAAHAESARDLFAAKLPENAWQDLSGRLRGSRAEGIRPQGAHEAESIGPGGGRLLFRRDPRGQRGWGYAGLSDAGADLERRALADLELVRRSAADYERAATRQGR